MAEEVFDPGILTIGLARRFAMYKRGTLLLTDRERLARYGARHPDARTTDSFDDLLADDGLDAIVIATPVITHAELAEAALQAGKHVFVEKPLAVSAETAESLVSLAEERGLVLFPGHLLLYHPGVIKLKELVDSGSPLSK